MKQVYRKRFKKNASTVCGVVFTITWDRLREYLQKSSRGRLGEVVSIRADEKGLHVFSEGGDSSAWEPRL
jgi:hypothetical protein